MNRSPPGVLFLDLGVRNSPAIGRRGVQAAELRAGVVVAVLPSAVQAPPWVLHLLLVVGVLNKVADRSANTGEDMMSGRSDFSFQFCSKRFAWLWALDFAWGAFKFQNAKCVVIAT